MNEKFKRFNAFTLAKGGHSPLLYEDDGTQGSPLLAKGAFTLAEVLITLGIIGVVAAMTLPTLVQNYQKKQTVVQLKKAYSELSQAISMAQKDLGLMEDWDFANFPTSADRAQYFYDNVLKPNLKIVKYCAPSSNDCWADDSFTLTGSKYAGLVNERDGRNSFITTSGYSVHYWLNANGTGGWIFIDLNGSKKPNILGKDIFTMWFCNIPFDIQGKNGEIGYAKVGFSAHGLKTSFSVSRDNIVSGNMPYISSTVGGCSKTGEGYPGLDCAALIMVDGWEIKDDYPW